MSLSRPLRRAVAVPLLGLLLGSAGASPGSCPGMNEAHASDAAPAADHHGAHAQHEPVSSLRTTLAAAHAPTPAALSLDSRGQRTDLPACAAMSHCAASMPAAGAPAAPGSDLAPASTASARSWQLHSTSLQHVTPPPRA